MSAIAREVLAAAASTVEGISVTPWFRQTTKAGQGMVRLDRRIRDESGLPYFNNVWQVLIVLPQDIAAAEKYLEQKLDALLEALSEQMAVSTATPQQLAIDTGTVPVVVIEGTRESE